MLSAGGRWRLPAAVLLQLITLTSLSKPGLALESSHVVDLHQTNFSTYLKTLPEDENVLMEFFAHWCPHCMHFKPKYEEVGSLFANQQPGTPRVVVARLDCALKENVDICGKFKVERYPTVRLSKAMDFLKQEAKDGDAKEDNPNIKDVEQRQAVGILKEVGKLLGVSFSTLQAVEVADEVPKKLGDLVRKEENQVADLADIERATFEMFDHIMSNKVLLDGRDSRKAFSDLLQLMATAHPSSRCKKSIEDLWKQLNEVWPEKEARPSEQIQRFRVCTKQYQLLPWRTCKGSKPDSREYTCGVWVLMHSMAARVPEMNGAKLWHAGMSGFIQYFFGCKECADHFDKLLQGSNALKLKTPEEVVMWLWNAHNTVNARLATEEQKEGTMDPDFPKVQWPWKELCPLCHAVASGKDTTWNEKEVYIFLLKYYKAPIPPPTERSRWSGKDNDRGHLAGYNAFGDMVEKNAPEDPKNSLPRESQEKNALESKQEVSKEVHRGYGYVFCFLILGAVVMTLRFKPNNPRKAWKAV